MPDRSQPVVQSVGLCKTFRDFWRRPRVEAVKDLNFEIRPGEVFGLLGPNGSGKTTTIKMLLGLLYPTRGRISVFAKAPTDVSVKSRIGFLPEESYLYRFLVARETLDYFGRLFRLPARVRRERTERLLDMVGLRHEAKRPVGEYSKGMARRIGLAQALINDPEFLILDEPTAGLDPIGSKQIKDVIRALGRKGKTILLSSHVLADVEDVCDRVTILYGGQERATGEVHELLRQGDVTQMVAPSLSERTIEQVREVIRNCEHKDLLEVTNPRVRLEEFFLRIVDEAQAANIRTYGARRGGDLPDFLQAEATTEQVVDSLVAAAGPKPDVLRDRAAAIAPAPRPEAEPSREVIEELVGERPERRDEAARPAARPAEPIPVKPQRTRVPIARDEAVIEALLHNDARRGSEGDDMTDDPNKPDAES
jgi:ABC-2 type transport system ATP-binding protein